MTKILPYKTLSRQDSLRIAKAVARGDASRLDDILSRIGGIDEQPIKQALDPDDSIRSMISQNCDNGLALRKLLARCPEPVWDYMAQCLADDNFVISRAFAYGFVRPESNARSFFAALERSGVQDSLSLELLLIHCADFYSDSGRPLPSALQPIEHAKNFFKKIGLPACQSLQQAKPLQDNPLLREAVLEMTAQALLESCAPDAPPAPPKRIL